MTRAEIIQTARTFLGTPFQHQGRLKGQGVDCVGLLICVARELGVLDSDLDYTGYRRQPDGVLMMELMNTHLVPKPENAPIQPGDVLAIRYRAPQHTAIVTRVEGEHFWGIHAVERGVVEHRFDARWKNRIVGVYEIPGTEEVEE